MYLKKTMFASADQKYTHRDGHAKKVVSVPPGTKYIAYYVYDMSGKGRSGMATLNFDEKTTDAAMAEAAKKA